jgi:hypothetical protein
MRGNNSIENPLHHIDRFDDIHTAGGGQGPRMWVDLHADLACTRQRNQERAGRTAEIKHVMFIADVGQPDRKIVDSTGGSTS